MAWWTGLPLRRTQAGGAHRLDPLMPLAGLARPAGVKQPRHSRSKASLTKRAKAWVQKRLARVSNVDLGQLEHMSISHLKRLLKAAHTA